MLFHFFFLFFFSNVMGVPELLVVLAATIAILIDAVTDPVMGQISDNFRSEKWGRRHLFMFWSIFPTAIALALLFSPPDGMGTTGLFFWMLFFTLAVRIGLTVFGVPYYSLGAEMSSNYNERTNIVSVREFFNSLFNLMVFIIGFMIFLPDTQEFEDGMMNQAGYSPFVITMAIIGVLGALVATFGTKHKVKDLQSHKQDPRTSWTQTVSQIRAAVRIADFRWLCGGYSLMLILYGAGSALSFYLGVYLWQFSQAGKLVVTMAPFVALIPAVILASVLSAVIDKKPAILIFAALYFFCSVLPYAAFLMGWLPDIGDPFNLTFITILNGLSFIGLTGVIIISNSMIADLADELELASGKRQEGILYAAFSFAQKLTFVVGTSVASIALILINFPKQTDPSAVSQSAINGLAITSLATAVIFGLLGIFCYMRYTLTRQRHADIQEQLMVRGPSPS